MSVPLTRQCPDSSHGHRWKAGVQMNQREQYEADAKVHPQPWELWHTIKNGLIGWRQCNSVDMDFSNSAYRRHKHADLMIQEHLHPEYRWELKNVRGEWVETVPVWYDDIEYRRKEMPHPHQAVYDALEEVKKLIYADMRNMPRLREGLSFAAGRIADKQQTIPWGGRRV